MTWLKQCALQALSRTSGVQFQLRMLKAKLTKKKAMKKKTEKERKEEEGAEEHTRDLGVEAQSLHLCGRLQQEGLCNTC